MKKLKIIASALLIAVSLSSVAAPVSAATSSSKPTTSSSSTAQTKAVKKPSTATIAKAIYSPSKAFSRLEKKKKADVDVLYGDNSITKYLKSYAVYITPIMPGGHEIAVFHVKDKKYLKKAQAAAKYRQEALKETAWYPSERDNAENSQIVTQGNYVLFVADDDADKIVKNFKSYYKKNLK